MSAANPESPTPEVEAHFDSKARSTLHLGSNATRGLVRTATSRWTGFIITFSTTTVLARLLSPADYGAYASVAAIALATDVLLDLGLSAAAIQSVRLSQRSASTLFYCNAAMGFILCLAQIMAASWLGDFFHETRVASIALLLAPGIVLNALAVQFKAHLSRSLNFSALARIDLFSSAVGSVVSVALAAAGLGVTSLPVGVLAASATRLISAALLSPWRPGRPDMSPDTRHLLALGAQFAASQLINTVSQALDTLLIGRLLGTTPLGLYNRAYQLAMLPAQQLTAPLATVVTPTISAIRTDTARTDRLLSQLLIAISYVALPFTAIASVCSPMLVNVIYGPHWSQASPLLQVLIVAATVRLYSSSITWIATAHGLARTQLGFTVAAQILVLGGIVLGVAYGGLGVAVGYTITSAIVVPIGVGLLAARIGISVAPTFRRLGIPISASLVAAALGFTSRAAWFPPKEPYSIVESLTQACALSGIMFLTYCLLLAVLPTARRDLSNISRLFRKPTSLRGVPCD